MTEADLLRDRRMDELERRIDSLWDSLGKQRQMIDELASQLSELVPILEMNFQNICDRLPKAK